MLSIFIFPRLKITNGYFILNISLIYQIKIEKIKSFKFFLYTVSLISTNTNYVAMFYK